MKQLLLQSAATGLLLAASVSAHATLILHSNFAGWNANVTTLESLSTTSANVALADEVSSPPGSNEQLGVSTLTFQAANTGLSSGFQVSTVQSGAKFTFDDDENGSNFPNFDDALSIGDIDNHDTDSFTFNFLGGKAFNALAFEIRDNSNWANESIELFDVNAVSLGIFDLAIADSQIGFDNDSQFIGLLSSVGIGSILFTEGNESGNNDAIALANIHFGDEVVASSSTSVPVPASLLLMLVGGLTMTLRRRRQQAPA